MSPTSNRPADPWAASLHERKHALRTRSDALRRLLGDECREGWLAASAPLDRAWTWRSRLLRVWQVTQTITAHRPWLLVVAPLAWRLLRRVLRRSRPEPVTRHAAQAAAPSGPSNVVRWARRLSAWWSTWRVLRPVLQTWLDETESARRRR
jgi:hypothetical protein